MEAKDDPIALEHAAADEGRRAARELYKTALAELDRQAVDASGGYDNASSSAGSRP